MKTTTRAMQMKKLTLFFWALLLASPLSAQELLVVFAANLDNSGGLNGSDNSGADLYRVRFNPQTQTVTDLQRLTATSTDVEFFPSLSPDAKWVAYNHQSGGQNEIRLLHLESKKVTSIFSGGRFPEWVNARELLATYVSRDTQDVFLLKLDLSNDTPKVLSRQQITDRTRCPDTSIGSDAFPFGKDLSVYDSRYASVPVCSYAYQAWGGDEHALFHSVTGNNQNAGVALTRLLYTTFDAQWQNPRIVDFSTAVEKLAGKTGRDFSTCSARLISSPPESGVVYVTLAMHNEDNFPTTQQVYLTSRANLIEFGKMLQRNNAPFNWESDWRFLNAVLQWDTPQVMASTNGKNLVRYLKEDLGLSVDPHSHENQGYNYADVAHLIDSLGVTPTNVVGGHIWDPNESLYQNWERFKQPLKGNRFPWAEWKGNILMGSATGMHRNDPEPSGVWRPKGKYEFWLDDSTSTVHAVGQHKGTLAGVQELVNLYKTGAVAPDKILTATLVIGQPKLNPQYIAEYESNTLKPLLDMQSRGEIKIVTFGELIEEWKTKYNSAPHLILANTTAVAEDEAVAPSGFVLAQNYPNPFNPATTIRFSLPQREHVTLKVFDVTGREVATLMESGMNAGEHAVKFNASNLPSGVYFYRLTAGQFNQTRKALLMK